MFDVFWFRFPLLRSLFALVLGIYVQSIFLISGLFIAVMGVLNIALIVLLHFKKNGLNQSVYKGFVLNVFVLIVGMGILQLEHNQSQQFYTLVNDKKPAYIQVENKTMASNGNFQYSVGLFLQIKVDQKFQRIGSLLLKKIDCPDTCLTIGSCIAFDMKKVSFFQNTGNPHEFNFANYYLKKGIYGQIYHLQKPTILYKAPYVSFKNCIVNAQIYLRRLIQLKMPAVSVSGVLLALIDGDDSLIPKQLLNAYASTGTLHVLAVSGMHVGLIYALIGFALFWMKLPAFKIPKLLLQLTLVWLYAILCGFSPSIIRAAIMISLHAFAACTDRPQQQINVLFSSAFVMLFLNPNLLFDAGFQLSFCAVLGLLTLYQPICRIWPIDNKWVIPVWKLSAASIAAQLATLPLAVYHFHQFPMLFLPANLLVVPVCTLCIYWGLLLVSIPNLPDAIWNALASTIELINQFTLHLAAFRWVKIDYLYLSESVAIIFAMAIVGLVISIKNKSGLFLQLAICCFLLIQIQLFVKKYAIYTHPFIRVYAYNNHPCLAIVAGMQSVIVTDSVCSIEKPFTMGLKLDGIYTCNIVKIKQNSPSIHIKNYSFNYEFKLNRWLLQINEPKGIELTNLHQKKSLGHWLLSRNTPFELFLY
jgi:competence protein ComEC